MPSMKPSLAPVKTTQTSTFSAGRRSRRRATSSTAATPEALSEAPGTTRDERGVDEQRGEQTSATVGTNWIADIVFVSAAAHEPADRGGERGDRRPEDEVERPGEPREREGRRLRPRAPGEEQAAVSRRRGARSARRGWAASGRLAGRRHVGGVARRREPRGWRKGGR